MLTQLLDEELERAGVSPERRAAERERLMISVKALIAWFAERRARKAAIYREKKGVLRLDGGVELSGVADRIEIAAGHVAILDFKTGRAADRQAGRKRAFAAIAVGSGDAGAWRLRRYAPALR